jgi:hypothetical protein
MFAFATKRCRFSRAPLRVCMLAVVIATGVAVTSAPAQQKQPVAPVYVRGVRIDPLLIEFGVDTAQLRRAVVDALRTGSSLTDSAARNTPALDIAVTVLRNLTGAELEPNALVSVEVGRNLVEAGAASALVWERRSSLRSYPTWQALSENTPGEVLRSVGVYVDSLRHGG